MRSSDWSSDVCSSDLLDIGQYGGCEEVARPIDDRSAGHDPCARRNCSLHHAVDPGELAGRDDRPPVRLLLPGIADDETANGGDRKSVVQGKSVLVSVDLVGR